MAVDVDGFWQVVERARTAAGPAADRAREDGQPSAVAEMLVEELSQLALPDIIAFDRLLDEVLDQVDNWDTCAACWVIEHGFLSDDGFSDFRAGLVGLGRSAFEAVVSRPDSLADHDAVREISASNGQNLWIGDEELLFAAQKAYARRTGDDDAFWDAADAVESEFPEPTGNPKPADDRWDLRDEDEWRRRLPRLASLFLAHRLAPK
ncbi:DUF4240 domain-containing protein [Micromonospora sp. LAH09]|uniref:DUF4240 domain-containing protein n=1 Tax=Micromonospora cabrerizensis TaxID=2911213 RepID=UPI001EE99302|nr:DUF4240 domain-containing protein [Micromonospora cabrerizensis]MCG5468925.1 DUF4240 domain-containing protein [Micromonospora cabrerizensis]